MSRWMDDAVEAYLTALARAEHDDPVLVDMEARAAEHGFPIVGRATGRYLELAARSVGARRVIELGSGYGYSAYWFARAVGSDPRSAAERCSWTRRSVSLQVTGLRASRNAANPWTHVRTVFEPTTSRDADEARTRPQRPAITTAVLPTCPSGC
jgi:hypothetical protein